MTEEPAPPSDTEPQFPDAPPEPWTPGQTVCGEFVFERWLGSGGFGEVALVRSRHSGEPYAAKRSRRLSDEQRISFLTELRHWMNLPTHPHLVACRFFRTVTDEVVVFSEYLSGGSLADWLADGRINTEGPRGALRLILDIAIQSAWGLHAVHELGIVHQDVKPGNLLISADGIVKIGDVGLAGATYDTIAAQIHDRLLDFVAGYWTREVPAKRETVKGKVGRMFLESDPWRSELVARRGATRAYGSPEQAERNPVTRQTDMWSWGLTVLEMFSGERTWISGTVAEDILDDLLRHPPQESLPPMPDRLAEILRSCFRRRPEDRPASLGGLALLMLDIFREECGEDYPRTRPLVPAPTDLTWKGIVRSWRDPRVWLLECSERLQLEPTAFEPWWPVRYGSRKSQLLSDFVALEQTRRTLELLRPLRLADVYRALGGLHLDIALVEQALADTSGALDACEAAIAYLQPLRDADASVTLARTLALKADLLRRLDRDAAALIACDRSISVSEGLYAAGQNAAKLLCEALNAKVTVLIGMQDNAGDACQLAVAACDRVLKLAGTANEEIAEKTLDLKAMALCKLGQRQSANDLWTSLASRLTAKIDGGRFDLRPIRGEGAFNHANAFENPNDKLKCFERAAEDFSELVSSDDRQEFTAQLGLAHLHAGDLLRASKPIEALHAYSQAREALTRAIIEEGRSELASDLAAATLSEAMLAASFGTPDAALQLAYEAVEMRQRLAQLDGSAAKELELVTAEANLGNILVDVGLFEEALQHLERAIALARSHSGKASDRDVRNLVSALQTAASVYRATKAPDRAVERNEEALDLVRTRLGNPPRPVAGILVNLGKALDDMGQLQRAVAVIGEGADIFQSIADGGDTSVLQYLADARAQRGQILSKLGYLEGALQVDDVALQIYDRLILGENRHDLKFAWAKALSAKALVLRRMSHLDESTLFLKQAIAAVAQAPTSVHTEEAIELATFWEAWLQDDCNLLDAAPEQFDTWAARAQQEVAKAQQSSVAGQMVAAQLFFDDAITIYTQLAKQSGEPRFYEAAQRTRLLKQAAAAPYRDLYSSAPLDAKAALAGPH